LHVYNAHCKQLNVENVETGSDLYKYKDEDFRKASEKTVDQSQRLYDWDVYPEYEIVPIEGHEYIFAPLTVKQIEGRWSYRPLARQSGYLFLEFANWPEEYGMDKNRPESENNQKAALAWAETFGVLGTNPADFAILGSSSEAVTDFLGYAPDGSLGRGRRNKACGGYPNESVRRFAGEAWEAHLILRLYEAVTDVPEPNTDAIIEYMSWSTRDGWNKDPEQAYLWALGVVEETVQRKLEQRCYPILVGDPGSYQQGWTFDSLLGAMWLQMMWLMLGTSRRCDFCKKIIELEDSGQSGTYLPATASGGKRKPPSHQRFCRNSGKCRSKWNYHYGDGKSSKAAKKQAREAKRS
jgi:hypothetical protein